MNKKYTVYYFDFEASTNGEKHIMEKDVLGKC